MLYTDVIDKTVIDINSMKKLGEIDGLFITPTLSVSYFSTNNGYYIPAGSVNAVGDVMTVALSAADIETTRPNGVRLPDVGAEIIDTSGKLVGRVEGYAFTKDERLKTIISGEIRVTAQRVIKYGAESILVKGRNRSKIDTKTAKADLKSDSDADEERRSGYPFDSVELDACGMLTPKLVSNYDFLIGRRVKKDIRKNNTVIVLKDMIIDAECVKSASEAGKLVELAIYSDR